MALIHVVPKGPQVPELPVADPAGVVGGTVGGLIVVDAVEVVPVDLEVARQLPVGQEPLVTLGAGVGFLLAATSLVVLCVKALLLCTKLRVDF